MYLEFITTSTEETEAAGMEFAKTLKPSDFIAMFGDLGAGKTAFVRGAAKHLAPGAGVQSPTYTIVQEYQLPGGARLYHMDLYRIADSAAALGFGVDEFIDDPKAYKLIEWPERIESLLPEKCLTVEITHQGDEERTLRITP